MSIKRLGAGVPFGPEDLRDPVDTLPNGILMDIKFPGGTRYTA